MVNRVTLCYSIREYALIIGLDFCEYFLGLFVKDYGRYESMKRVFGCEGCASEAYINEL